MKINCRRLNAIIITEWRATNLCEYVRNGRKTHMVGTGKIISLFTDRSEFK